MLEHFGEGAGLDEVLAAADGQLAFEEFLQEFYSEVAVRHVADLGQEVVGQDGNVGFVETGGGEYVDDAFGYHGLGDDLANGKVQFLVRKGFGGGFFGERGAHGLEKGDVVADARCFGVGHGEGEGLGQLAHGVEAAFLAVLLCKDILLGGGQQVEALLGRAGRPDGPVEAVQQPAADVVLLLHDGDRFGLVDGGAAGAAALGVGGERLLQVLGQAQVVDDEAAGLVLEDAVDAGDGLHQSMAAHWLVDVERVEAGCVEAGEPHIAHEHGLQRVVGVAEALGQFFAAGFVSDVGLPVRRIGGGSCHDHFDGALGVVFVFPTRAEMHELAVEIDTDAAAHADDHGLAVQDLQPLLEVGDDIFGDLAEPILRPDYGFQLRPFALEFLGAFDLLALGDLFELRVDFRPLALEQFQLCETAFVEDRHGGAVFDGALDVVDADVVAEDGACVGVLDARWACR